MAHVEEISNQPSEGQPSHRGSRQDDFTVSVDRHVVFGELMSQRLVGVHRVEEACLPMADVWLFPIEPEQAEAQSALDQARSGRIADRVVVAAVSGIAGGERADPSAFWFFPTDRGLGSYGVRRQHDFVLGISSVGVQRGKLIAPIFSSPGIRWVRYEDSASIASSRRYLSKAERIWLHSLALTFGITPTTAKPYVERNQWRNGFGSLVLEPYRTRPAETQFVRYVSELFAHQTAVEVLWPHDYTTFPPTDGLVGDLGCLLERVAPRLVSSSAGPAGKPCVLALPDQYGVRCTRSTGEC